MNNRSPVVAGDRSSFVLLTTADENAFFRLLFQHPVPTHGVLPGCVRAGRRGRVIRQENCPGWPMVQSGKAAAQSSDGGQKK